jgi:hypothetical protein
VEKATARELALQAADAFDAGDYETALDEFTRAQQLYPAPTLSFMQARCLYRLGRWVEAYEIYNETARAPLADDAPDAYTQAVSDARAEADDLQAKLPRIEIRVPETPGLTVTIDDRLLPPAMHNVTHPIDPGAHHIRALVDDEGYFEQTVMMVQRDFQLIAIPRPKEEVVPITDDTLLDEQREARPSRGHSRTPAWVVPTAFALGGVGSAAAVVSLILGSGVKSDLDAVCHPGCPPAMEDELQSYRLYRALFITGAAVGAVGIGTGVYFVLSDSSDDGAVALAFTPTGARVFGAF